MERATFGAGCFWGVEAAFRNLGGVSSTSVGYCGGSLENPTYEMVCAGKSGHAEVVEVEYDPEQVSYERLLAVFWQLHDPTTLNRQGLDIGSQYRSVIFCHNAEQEEKAMLAKEKLAKSGKYRQPIVTQIAAAQPFYRAEEYHQQYFQKHGLDSCRVD